MPLLTHLLPALRAAVDRQTARAARLTRPDLAAYCVTEEQAALLLADLDPSASPVPPDPPSPPVPLDLPEPPRSSGPLAELAARAGLSRTEQDVLLLVAAPDLDPAYQKLYAYVVDDLRRGRAGIELLAAVLGGGIPAMAALLAEHAPLCRHGLVRRLPGADPLPSAEFRLGDGVLGALLGWTGHLDHVPRDPGAVAAPPGFTPPPNCDPAAIARLGAALAVGRLDLVGVWGGAGILPDVALAIALAAGRPLRTLTSSEAEDGLSGSFRTAGALDALIWLPADDLPGTAFESAVVEALTTTRQPVIITGTTPWRPVRLLACRGYAEMVVPAADHRQRQAAWSAALPDLGEALVTDLAVRYRMGGEELRAVASVASAGARFAGNGRPDRIENHVPPALAVVTRGHTTGYARAVQPRHTLDDLVLPVEQFERVREIESAFRAWPRVAEAWGFARRGGDAGVKVLFTGEPGTGKTLSAEILAGRLGLDLLKVDLSQVVSKWIGETEKNLELVFRQAEESQAVMFFDEADALFGKRGDVRHGTDRYANLEVGYLLQRLEASNALVILASNLQENIDVAFTRRFHFVVNFSRPGYAERLRLWQRVFPPEAPVASDLDPDALARLDMTGAAIASAARSAALTAADGPGHPISMRDVVAGVARQYQREARLLRPDELGDYAALLAREP